MAAYYLALLTAFIWGFVPILEKFGLRETTPLTGLAIRSLGVILGLILMSFFYSPWTEMTKMPGKSILSLLLSGFLASFVAQLVFYHALKIGDVSRIVPVSGTYPLIAFALGIIILGEKVTLVKIIGASLVVLGVYFLK